MRAVTGAIALAAAAATLSACGQSTKETAAVTGQVNLKNASQAEVTEQVAAANRGGAVFTPGHWEGSVTLLDMAMPGLEKLPPAMRAQMQAQMQKSTLFEDCLTPDEAADAKAAISKGQGGDCLYDHFTMANGRIDAAMSCKVGKALHKMTMTGSFTPDDYRLVSQASGGGTGSAGPMSMKMEIKAHRTGACTGNEDKDGGTK